MPKKLAVWGYTSYQDKRYVGLMPKGQFLDKVTLLSEGRKKRSKWVLDRMAETGNDEELRLANLYPGKIVEVGRFKQFLQVHNV